MRYLLSISCLIFAIQVKSEVISKDLIIDLNANKGLELLSDKVMKWQNQVTDSKITEFVVQNKGRKVLNSGAPSLKKGVSAINGNNSILFKRQELINHDEDSLDHLITGSGYTWISVLCVHQQKVQLKDLTMGRWDKNNPKVLANSPLKKNRFYIIAGRMGSGQGTVQIDLFINEASKITSKGFPVNPSANSSKLAIGQERDAIEHPGKESFDGEIARFLLYDRPLLDDELKTTMLKLKSKYGIQ